jgi:hypothetical protein
LYDLRGVARFIIVTQNSTEFKFKLATYTFENLKLSDLKGDNYAALFESFNGKLLLKDLTNGTIGIVKYADGVRLNPNNEIATAFSTMRTEGYECEDVYTCYWSYPCGSSTASVVGGTTRSVNGYCQEPTQEPGGDCNWGQNWRFEGSYYEGQECRYVEEPPLPGSGCSCSEEYGTTPMPCPGDVVKDQKIAPANGWNIKGGRRGYTRFDGTKYHDGLDIAVAPDTPLGSMYEGTVVDVVSSFPVGPAGYKENSYGNYITIRTTLPNGEVIDIKYNHLNRVDLNIGDVVYPGTVIGLAGLTGNAWAKGVVPHVHVQVYKGVNSKPLYQRSNGLDPETYSATKYDSNGNPTNVPC